MTMDRNSHRWKRWARVALAVVLVLDLALFVINWRAAQVATQAQRDQAAQLNRKTALLEADVARADAIRRQIPEIRQNSDRFYAEQFLPVSTGYSAVVADLGELAGHAGVKTNGISFKQKTLEKRDVVEVQITAAVDGDYPSVIHFINGLERSKNFYLLDNLTLASATTGSIKLQLELRTYFRA